MQFKRSPFKTYAAYHKKNKIHGKLYYLHIHYDKFNNKKKNHDQIVECSMYVVTAQHIFQWNILSLEQENLSFLWKQPQSFYTYCTPIYTYGKVQRHLIPS